jgi:hypothetical protein
MRLRPEDHHPIHRTFIMDTHTNRIPASCRYRLLAAISFLPLGFLPPSPATGWQWFGG